MKTLRMFFVLLLAITMLAFGGSSPANAEGQGDGCTITTLPSGFVARWVNSHTFEFRAGFWQPGWHTYEIAHTDPDAGNKYFFKSFLVSQTAPLYNGQVFLRTGNLRAEESIVSEINPAQDTAMQVTFLTGEGETRSDLLPNLIVRFRWDNVDWVDVPSGPIVSACSWQNHGRSMRTWGPVY